MTLSLIPATADDYPFLFDIEPPAHCRYDDWLTTVQAPQWANFCVYKEEQRAGGLFLERISDNTVEFHYSTIRRTIKPTESARLLTETARILYAGGVECIQALPPATNRAAIRLAQSCGMSFDSYVIRDKQPFHRYFLMRRTFLHFASTWD